MIRHLRDLEHYAVQFLNQGRFIFSGQFCHIGDIDPGFFGKRQRQCLGCGIHPANTDFLLDGAFGEHIRLADKVAIAVHDLQRTQQKIGVIIVKCRVIGSLGNAAIFFDKSIIQAVQPLLFCSDQVFRIILRLVLNKLPDAIPQPDQPLDPTKRGGGYLHWIHTTVFPVINLSVHNGIREIAHGGVSRYRTILLQPVLVLPLILPDRTANVTDRGSQPIGKFLTSERNAGCFRPIGTADLLHFTQNHFRVVNKILVHLEAVFIYAQVHPIRFYIGDRITFLQKQNI